MTEEVKFTLKDLRDAIDAIPCDIPEQDMREIKPIIVSVLSKLTELKTGLFTRNKAECGEIDDIMAKLDTYIHTRSRQEWVNITEEPEEDNVKTINYLKELQEIKPQGFNSDEHETILQKAIESIHVEAINEKDIEVEGDEYIKLLKLNVPKDVKDKIWDRNLRVKGELVNDNKYKCSIYSEAGDILSLAAEQTMSEAIVLAMSIL